MNLDTGTYRVTVTDDNGCIIQHSVEIIEPQEILNHLISTDVICFGEENGTIDIDISGGIKPYTYFWNDSTAFQDRVGLGPGEYVIRVIDSNNCMRTDTIIISEPDLLEISTSMVTPITNTYANDGAISIEVTGGTVPYSINWGANHI